MTSPSRFLLFRGVWGDEDAEAGWHGYVGSHETLDAATAAAAPINVWEWAHVVDLDACGIVAVFGIPNDGRRTRPSWTYAHRYWPYRRGVECRTCWCGEAAPIHTTEGQA